VGISGNVIVAGKPHVWYQGTAEVFRWNGAEWAHETSLIGSERRDGDQFGWSVAIDGERILVGAYVNPAGGPGAAHFFVADGGGWIEEIVLSPTDHTHRDYFGQSVGISGERAIVAAPYIYSAYAIGRTPDATWALQQKLTPPPDAPVPYFGSAVSIDGDLSVVMGGHPYVFQWDQSVWRERARLVTTGGFGIGLVVKDRFAVFRSQVFAVRDQHSLRDYAGFQECFTGNKSAELSAECLAFDLNGDGRVDLTDYEVFVGTFVGP